MSNTSHQVSDLPRVGYWWSEKKSRKVNANEFTKICRSSGLELVKIDLDRPLEEQGPFTAIVHKLSDVVVKAENGDSHSKAVCQAFQDYAKNHPETVVIDPLPNVEKLLNRYRQYKLVEDSELQKEGGVLIPAFVELTTNNIKENVAKLREAGVTFPFVCKPSLSHGCTLAHQMSLIFNEEGLKDINPPCVAQTFVNHNAILYKLFIIGDKYFIIERPSLKNFSAGDHETIFFDSHDISKPHSASSLTELDDSEPKTPVIWPEKEKMDHIVQILCKQLGLALFGIDVIVDNKTGHHAIIDMNIFPGWWQNVHSELIWQQNVLDPCTNILLILDMDSDIVVPSSVGYDQVDNFRQLLCDLIVSRISMRVNGIPNLNTCKPKLANCSWIGGPKMQYNCKKVVMDSKNPFDCSFNSAVITYTEPCFCCPIVSTCNNMVSEFHVPDNDCQSINKTNHAFPLHLSLKGPVKKCVSSYSTLAFNSVSTAQDDSGIETSDSCDEKKKEVAVRSVKRQHSRSYVSSTLALEESDAILHVDPAHNYTMAVQSLARMCRYTANGSVFGLGNHW